MINRLGYSKEITDFNEEELKKLKANLTVKPEVLPDYDYGQIEPFEVFRVTEARIYVPKFYGLEKYGPVDKKYKKLPEIELNFNGSLMDHQIKYCGVLLDEIKQNDSCIAHMTTGGGKCMAFNTPVIMHNGSIKMAQDIKTNDILMGDDSTPRKVLSLASGVDTMYEIVPTKGEKYTFNSDHILCLKTTNIGLINNKQNTISNWSVKYLGNDLKILCKSFSNKKDAENFNNVVKNKVYEISIKQYLKLPKHVKHILKIYRSPIEFCYKEVVIDPYILGYWIGDGASNVSKITSQDSIVLKYISKKITEYDGLYMSYTGFQYDYIICSTKNKNYFMSCLRSLNLLNNKHIPNIYKINSREIRLELLAGLIDSDGHLHNGCYEFTQKNETTMDDVIYLARSLGFFCCKKIKKTSWIYKNEKKYGTTFITMISGNIEEIPCKILRKQAKKRKQIKNVLMTSFKIIEKNVGTYYGFEIDGNGRYLLGDTTVTHNTVCALWLVAQLKKKTLIVVHKEFLMNQWIERIKQFLPEAKIGTIRQEKLEIENNDIIIGMIQTITSRIYEKGTFDSIGYTIYDEAHHLAASKFSQVLYKCGSRYSLALSATPKRKDGLTKVLQWFLGTILTNEMVSNVDTPSVKIVNAEYSSKIVPKHNFKGLLNSPNLINQLVADEKRNEIIVNQSLLLVNYGRKQLILTGRRNHCYNLQKLLISKNSTISTGIYIGGMKEEDLKESNKADIIIATYQSVSEGYDNPSIDTLIMATGISDVTQSIGRILRRKNKNKPLIIDVTDKEFLIGQSKKRISYYKKNNFEIVGKEKEKDKELDITVSMFSD